MKKLSLADFKWVDRPKLSKIQDGARFLFTHPGDAKPAALRRAPSLDEQATPLPPALADLNIPEKKIPENMS